MIHLKQFVFNPFQLNTYLLWDDTKECIIIDPGCSSPNEESELSGFIIENQLKAVRLLNTHCHIDHILGNRFVFETYNLKPLAHKEDLYNLERSEDQALMFGLPAPHSPQPDTFLEEAETITFGKSDLKVLFTPGHTKGHVSFYSEKDKFIICGDVIFQGSIGRTDLPGGNYDQLIQSIQSEFFTLNDDIMLYPGHGPSTTIENEKKFNPFVGKNAL